MITQPIDIPADSIDIKSLASLINDLNVARRNCRSYPKGHPLIAASLAKCLHTYENLMMRHEEIVLGFTSDALMINGVILEKNNIVYRDFSRSLFERGIGALLFHRGLKIEELNNFMIISGLKREQINQHGGIENVWGKARITSMTIRPIRYDLFQTTDDDSAPSGRSSEPGEGLWDRFARELTRGSLPHGFGAGDSLDPEILAEILNQQFTSSSINDEGLHAAIADLLTPVYNDSASSTHSGQPYQKLATFISHLTPELRRQFLDSSFGANCGDRQNAAEQILSNLSDNAVLETLEDINNNRLSVSPIIFGLLQRLGHNAGSPHSAPEDNPDETDLSHKLKTIFREHASEEFVPNNYQNNLNKIIASDRIVLYQAEDTEALLKTLENRTIENSIGNILMNLIREGVETPEERDLLLQNLRDMFGFSLQTGDYDHLQTMVDQLTDDTFPVEIRQSLRDAYGQREYVEEILDGLSIWGKPRYGDIRTLIHKIGSHFVEAILDRLAEEKSMSLRRFYMDCLIEMGEVSRAAIVNRLDDNRWYFIRNLLIILVARNDPSILPHVRPLLRSSEPRLRHEVLKTLVHFRDPQAEKQILENLDSQNPELLMTAIQLAERCTLPGIARKLIGMLSTGGFSQIECERKSAIVYSLGEIGRADTLPELAKILGSRSLLHSRHLTKLKTDIIRSLSKYPPNVAKPVLEHIADGSGEIARHAAEILKIISGKHE